MASGLPAWRRREAFEYVESLAGPLLAWEYLRRNLSYRTAWRLCDPTEAETDGRDWGLLRMVDPDLDARAVVPIWRPDPPTTLRVIRSSSPMQGFKLYDLDIDRSAPGAVHEEEGTYLTALVGPNAWQVHVADGLKPQESIAVAIHADAYARRRVAAADRFIRDLERKLTSSRELPTVPGRATRFHASVIQSLDGAAAGASHREIAVALRGAQWVSSRWTPDGELRASIRYFLKRGALLVSGGYRQLIYR
jgi:hypothetical protein